MAANWPIPAVIAGSMNPGTVDPTGVVASALDNIERLIPFPRQQSNMIEQIVRAWP
jgi:hypothetical protein